MKNCPFCKSGIVQNTVVCPHCKHTLIEQILPFNSSYSVQQTINVEKTGTSLVKKVSNFLKNFTHTLKEYFFSSTKAYRFGHNKWERYKKISLVLAVVLFIFGLYIQNSQNPNNITSNSYVPVVPTVNTIDHSQAAPKQEIVSVKDPKTYVSLNNGTILAKNSYYLKGSGKLDIDNGTGSDAIAKLVNVVNNKSVYTVYIKSNSSYQIPNISDGNYRLLFNLGNDWNNDHKTFSVNSSYETFEENFDFTTSSMDEGDYINTQYTTFRVTLNPVINGRAKTNPVSAQEFGSY